MTLSLARVAVGFGRDLMKGWKAIIAIVALCSLVACGQSGEGVGAPAPGSSESQTAETAPMEGSATAPEPDGLESSEDTMAAEPAPPSPEEQMSADTGDAVKDLPTLAAPSPDAPATRGLARERSAAANGGSSGATAGGGMQRVTTAVIVEIGPNDLRRGRNGGSAVAVLSRQSTDFERNLRLCRALFAQIDSATVGEVIAGERVRNGRVQELRPLYWMLKTAMPAATGDRCGERISRYDFERAQRIRTKYNLTGRGPYLVIANTAETRVALVDFGAAPIGETEDLVRYFRDGFSQDDDIWTDDRHVASAASAKLTGFLGRSIAGAALTAFLKPVARAACPLGDLLDVCSGTTP
jgi:hypothetical protein